MQKLFHALAFMFICSSGAALFGQTIEVDFLIANVNVVDVRDGKLLPNRYVEITGDQVTGVHSDRPDVSPSTQIVDGSGKFCIPGLWDMHTHYNWNYTYASPLLIAHGITGIREMWGVMDTIKSIRERSLNGNLIAPDIYSAGNIIDGVPQIWPGSAGVKNPEEAVKEIEAQAREGVDFFKVYSRLSKESYMAIAKRSKELRKPFSGHIPSSLTIHEAIDAGQKSAEHLYGLLEACTSDPESLAELTDPFGPEKMRFLVETFDRNKFAALAKRIAESDMWLCPTLSVLESIAHLDDTTKAQDPRLEYMPKFIAQMWNPKNDFRFKSRGEEYYQASREKYKLQLSLIGQLQKAGVKMIAGTDYPNPYCYPGFTLHDELILMVAGGMSPADALKTATINAAEFMGRAGELGEVSPGQLASIVLLNGNPLKDIAFSSSVHAVFLRGKFLNRKALGELLNQAKEISAQLSGF